jgi:hypothetical protein
MTTVLSRALTMRGVADLGRTTAVFARRRDAGLLAATEVLALPTGSGGPSPTPALGVPRGRLQAPASSPPTTKPPAAPVSSILAWASMLRSGGAWPRGGTCLLLLERQQRPRPRSSSARDEPDSGSSPSRDPERSRALFWIPSRNAFTPAQEPPTQDPEALDPDLGWIPTRVSRISSTGNLFQQAAAGSQTRCAGLQRPTSSQQGDALS